MKMSCIAVVVGVRPHFIKAGPIVRQLESELTVHVLHTGQHYDAELTDVHMHSSRLREPDVRLQVGSGSPQSQVGLGLIKVEPELRSLAPDLVVIIGDANSSLIGALGAAQLDIPVCHVEAGVTKSRGAWIVEEVNRRAIDSIARLCLTPTRTKQSELAQHLMPKARQSARFMGDVLLDSVMELVGTRHLEEFKAWCGHAQRRHGVVVTLHRAETLHDEARLEAIVDRLISGTDEVDLILHPNSARRLQDLGLMRRIEASVSVTARGACPHDEMVRRLAAANVVVTDSSGVQRESYFLGRPCLVVRDDTEYRETVDGGGALLLGDAVDALNDAIDSTRSLSFTPDLGEFGSGRAAARGAREILAFLASEVLAS